MILLNVGAGGTLPDSPWVNIDYPHEHPEMPNYLRHDASTPLPYPDNSVDGLTACHFIEHFDCLKAVEILADFRRVLKPAGVCRVVVPDASYFRKVYAEESKDPEGTARRLFGEPFHLMPWARQKTFMDFALFWAEHKQLFTEDSLWCVMVQAGFDPSHIQAVGHQQTSANWRPVAVKVAELDNRELFSLRMEAFK